MIKRIKIEDLKLGMFIIDVTNTWSKLLKLPNKTFVENEQLINKLKQNGFKEIFVDLSKKQLVEQSSSGQESSSTEIKDIQKLIKEAESTRSEVSSVIDSIMTDAGKGKKIELGAAHNAVKKVVDFTLENQYLLAGLVLMRRKSRYIFEHALGSCVLMIAFAKTYGLDIQTQKDYGMGAMLHDIGMMQVSSKILNKRGELTASETSELKRHVQYGYNLLRESGGVAESILQMAAQHHERINGGGYPQGLQGDEISLPGQMAAIVDVYNAATSDRGYKKGMAPARALAEILLKSESIFDSELVNIFIQSVGIYPFGSLVRLVNDLVGIVTIIDKDELLYPQVRIFYNSNKGQMITPYNISLNQHRDDVDYAILGVVEKEELFLEDKDIEKILGLN